MRVVAQQFDPKERAMLSGMERSLRAMDRVTEADFYERKIKRYRLSNPYYLFAMAEIRRRSGFHWVDWLKFKLRSLAFRSRQ